MGIYEDRWNQLDRSAELQIVRDAELEIAQREESYIALRKEFDDHMLTHGPTFAQQNIGIQVFPERQDLSYWDHDGTFRMLQFLGIKNVRGNVGPSTSQRTVDFFNKCYDELGIESCLTVGRPRVPLTDPQWFDVELILATMRGVKRLSGWNEPNHRRSASHPPLDGWPTLTGNEQEKLWDRFNENYLITSMQMWSGNRDKHDADLATVADRVRGKFHEIAWHLYQMGLDKVEHYEQEYYGHFGSLPVVCTETGMSTAPNQTSGAESMTEEERAVYIVEHCNMYLTRGHTVYWFETRNEFNPDGTNREHWLGIFDWEGNPLPAAFTLRDMLLAA